MKSPIQFFIAIAILLATATVAAQVYKWVDKDGQVQFTDTPPPPGATKSEAKKIDTGTTGPTTAPPKPADRNKAADKLKKEADEKGKRDTEARKKAEADEASCKNAKLVIRDLESGKPFKRNNEQGDSTYMTDEERQADLVKARAVAAATCKE